MAMLAGPEATAAVTAVTAKTSSKPKPRAQRKTTTAKPKPKPQPEGPPDDEPAASNEEPAPKPKRTGNDQEESGSGESTWSRAGTVSQNIVNVQAPRPIETGAGLLLGMIVWAIVLNWLRGGPGQAKGWILAKLINRPYGGAVGSANVKPSGPVTA